MRSLSPWGIFGRKRDLRGCRGRGARGVARRGGDARRGARHRARRRAAGPRGRPRGAAGLDRTVLPRSLPARRGDAGELGAAVRAARKCYGWCGAGRRGARGAAPAVRAPPGSDRSREAASLPGRTIDAPAQARDQRHTEAMTARARTHRRSRGPGRPIRKGSRVVCSRSSVPIGHEFVGAQDDLPTDSRAPRRATCQDVIDAPAHRVPGPRRRGRERARPGA